MFALFLFIKHLQIVATLEFMPAVILTSRLCPKGMEATVYALLAGTVTVACLVNVRNPR
jgi:hypothetical protein